MAPKTIVLPFANPLTALIDEPISLWHSVIFILCALTILRFVWSYWRIHVLNLWQALLWAYVLTYSLYLFEWPGVRFLVYDKAYKLTAAEVFAEALLIPIAAMAFRDQALKIIPYVVGWALIAVWTGWVGPMPAPSFNTALAAACVPFLPMWMMAGVVVTAITHHGATAQTILAVQALAYGIHYYRSHALPRWYTVWMSGLTVWALALCAFWHHDSAASIFEGTQRWWKWKEWMEFFYNRPGLWLTGMGPGSFVWKSLVKEEFREHTFYALHNEWLQILWECGMAGFVLVGGVYVRAVKDAWNSPQILAGLFGIAAFGFTYHPLRYPLSALLTALIVISCTAHQRRVFPT